MPDHRIKTKNVHPRKPIRKVFGAALMLTVVAAALWKGTPYVKTNLTMLHQNQTHKSHHKPFESTRGRFTTLLIGTDMRPEDNVGNADVIVVASVDESNQRIELMSIPRDTQVSFPDGKYHKINQSLQIGGPELTMSLTENLLGMPIDHYAITRFDGLVNIINTIHGIELDVPKRMYYVTGDKKYGIIHLNKGKQTLNGEQALAFVRYRKDALGDIGRTNRQQIFLSALSNKLLSPQSIRFLPSIAKQLWNSVDTDIAISDIPHAIREAGKMRTYTIVHETLPGSFHDPVPGDTSDLSYWVVNPAQARYVARQFFCNGVVQKNPVQDPQDTQSWIVPSDESKINSKKT